MFGSFPSQNKQQQQQQPNPFASGAFGQPAKQQANPFASGAFGQPAKQQPNPFAAGAFGQPAKQQANPFAAGVFGQPAKQQPNPFASGVFGQPAKQQANPFPAGAFGQPAKQQPNPFAAGAFGQPAKQQANSFAAGAFGQPAKQQANLFAAGAFGQPAKQQANSFASNAFEQPMKQQANTFDQQAKQQQQQQQQQQKEKFMSYSSLDDIKDKLYPSDYIPHRELMACLRSFYSTNKESVKLFDDCAKTLNEKASSASLPEKVKDMPIEYARAIICYTAELEGESSKSAYKLLNKALRDKNFNELKKFRDLFYLLMRSFRSLDKEECSTMYRGLGGTAMNFKVGDEITWSGFSSVSKRKEVAANFAKNGFIFEIRGASGYPLSSFSAYPDEEEVLLDLDSKFRVVSTNGRYVGLDSDDKPTNVPIVVIEYCSSGEPPLNEFINELAKREPKGSLRIGDRKGTYAVFLDDEDTDEWCPDTDGAGNPCFRNMRTGKIEWRAANEAPLPSGWEAEEDENGITYYINRAKRLISYERPSK